MSNPYDVLNLAKGASPEVIDAAYLAMRRKASESGDSALRADIESAYEVLSDPAKRAEFDATLDATVAIPAPEVVATAETEEQPRTTSVDGDAQWAAPGSTYVAPEPVVANGGSKKMLIMLTSMVGLLILLTGAGLGFFLLRDDDGGGNFETNVADDQLDLAGMGLKNEDVPEGISFANEQEFDNATWAEALVDTNAPDPEAALEAKKRQIEAQGRVRGYVKFYQSENPIEHLGRPFQFASQTSVFKDEQAAIDSIKDVCDLPLDGAGQVEDAEVKKLGDESTAFYVTIPSGELGLGNFKDTIICFRTGKLVHSITQRGLDGTEDLELNVELAEVMLEHVKAALGES